jgi:hypothetical protein
LEREDYKEEKARPVLPDREDDVVGAMMSKRRAASPPLNAPTGPAANGFSIKGRSKTTPMPPPTGPRAAFQPPKGPAADRDRERRTSLPSREKESKPQDHYAADRERHARERDRREKPSLSSRISGSKRSYDDDEIPRGPKAQSHDSKPQDTKSHRDKRRKDGDDGIAGRFTAGLRKNAKARRGGVRTEGDVEREMDRVERERERR